MLFLCRFETLKTIEPLHNIRIDTQTIKKIKNKLNQIKLKKKKVFNNFLQIKFDVCLHLYIYVFITNINFRQFISYSNNEADYCYVLKLKFDQISSTRKK